MEVFRLFESVSDWSWGQVQTWSPFAQNSIGLQLVRSADSVGANLVEGDGRYTDADSNKFFIIARGSARETRLWIRRASSRGLVSLDEAEAQIRTINHAACLLNRLITAKRKQMGQAGVRELRVAYGGEAKDPLAAPVCCLTAQDDLLSELDLPQTLMP